jgi:hypothetical protein
MRFSTKRQAAFSLLLLCAVEFSAAVTPELREAVEMIQKAAMNATLNPVFERLAYTCVRAPRCHLPRLTSATAVRYGWCVSVQATWFTGYIWTTTKRLTCSV